MEKATRIGFEREYINTININFEILLGYNRSELEFDDTDKELCEKIISNFRSLGIVCMLDYSMNIDDRLKLINDCFTYAKNKMP